MMDKPSYRSYLSTVLGVCVIFLVLTVIHCAPQGGDDSSLFVDVFQGQCADLESQGYEGYECTPRSRCDDGYIVNSAIDGAVGPKQHKVDYYGDEELDVSSYECPNVRQDYEYDSMGDEMICCRRAEFFKPGTEQRQEHSRILILKYYFMVFNHCT